MKMVGTTVHTIMTSALTVDSLSAIEPDMKNTPHTKIARAATTRTNSRQKGCDTCLILSVKPDDLTRNSHNTPDRMPSQESF